MCVCVPGKTPRSSYLRGEVIELPAEINGQRSPVTKRCSRSWVMMEDGAPYPWHGASPSPEPTSLVLGSHPRYWAPPWLIPPSFPGRNFLQKVLLAGGSDSPYSRAMRGQITLSQVIPWVPAVEHHRGLGKSSSRIYCFGFGVD